VELKQSLMMRSSSNLFVAAASSVALALSGCSDILDPARWAVESVEVEPASPAVEEGDQLQLRATVRAADGTVLRDRQVFWAVEDSSVARVSDTGMLTGLRVGQTRVAASAEGKHSLADLRVRPRPVARVELDPSSASLQVRGTAQFEVTLRDSNGGVLLGRSVSWSSSAPDVAEVDSKGRVRGLRPGSATITAISEGKSGSAAVEVRPGQPAKLEQQGDDQSGGVGQPLPAALVVRVKDRDDNPVSGVQVEWTVTHGGGSVDPSSSTSGDDGRATARWALGPRPGQHRVRARVGSLSVTFQAHARPGGLSSIAVSPETLELTALYDTAHLTVAALDEFENELAQVEFSWSSLSPAIATVDTNGMVEARANGVARIVAKAGGIADTASVRVQQEVKQVVVSPRASTLNALGHSRQLTAVPQDRNGHAVPAASVSWSSLNAQVANVNGSGIVTARARGTARIRVAAGGGADTAEITIRQIPASVSVAPRADTIRIGETTQLSASAADSNQVAIADASFGWASRHPEVAEVEGGRVTGKTPGTAVIVASSGQPRDSSVITVRVGPPAGIAVVSGDGQEGTVGDALPEPLVVEVTDSEGFAVEGAQVQWRADSGGEVSPPLSSTDANGRTSTSWTLTRPGKREARAEVGSLRATFTAHGSPRGLSSLSVEPSAVRFLALRDTAQLAVAAVDDRGGPVSALTFSWTSLSPTVASVNGSGVVDARANGVAWIVVAAEGRADTATVTVEQQVAELHLSPRLETFNALGHTRQLIAIARDRNGFGVASAAVTWSSLNSQVASVTQSGVVTAHRTGEAHIRASAAAAADTAEMVIRQIAATVRISPAAGTIRVAEDRQLLAAATDSADAEIPDASFEWSSSAPRTASVDEQGTVTGVTPGTATIRASTVAGPYGESTIVVQAPPIDRVVVTPERVDLSVGSAQRFTARLLHADGRELQDRQVSWSTDNVAVASSDSGGRVTARRPGSTPVMATSENSSGTARVSVNRRRGS
jgi:trimeric autotransporter adhesin